GIPKPRATDSVAAISTSQTLITQYSPSRNILTRVRPVGFASHVPASHSSLERVTRVRTVISTSQEPVLQPTKYLFSREQPAMKVSPASFSQPLVASVNQMQVVNSAIQLPTGEPLQGVAVKMKSTGSPSFAVHSMKHDTPVRSGQQIGKPIQTVMLTQIPDT